MTDRMKKWMFIAGMLAILLVFFAPILFTDKIIRAPDITNEFYWNIKGMGASPFWSLFKINMSSPAWNMFINSGYTTEGGDMTGQFLFFWKLIFWLFPPPASVAWYIVFQFFVGATGVYAYCRLIGTSRWGALLGGLVFVLATENVSLINAGHVMKMATISFAPWALYFIEKGFQTRKVVFFLSASVVLAYQFFHTHWQIAFYTCLAMGMYGILRTVGIVAKEKKEKGKVAVRLLAYNLLLVLFFVSTVAISLAPLANWSKDTNRGGNSGANSGANVSAGAKQAKAKGGLNREEAMMWSMPPEELGALFIPGMFGMSRQEAGENPSNIAAYYWGRMVFTQTLTYMGMLPWLLLPLLLIFRRDKFTWLALAAIVTGLLFSMGKYTPFYNILFDFFPGINRFRVPKMIMFIPVLGLGIVAARGLDVLLDEKARMSTAFKKYLIVLVLIPLALLFMLGVELIGKNVLISLFFEMLAAPTRYEEGPQLVMQRWNNLVLETGISAGLATLFAGICWAFYRKKFSAQFLPAILIALFLLDVGRVNSKFMFLVNEPLKAAKGAKNPTTEFLAKESKQYRVLPMDGSDPMQYVSNGIPVMFTSNAVQQMRWQQFLDVFSITGVMPDIMNVKYLVMPTADYQQQRSELGNKFVPVFTPPGAASVILENRKVLPKAWLVPSVLVTTDAAQRISILQNQMFNPVKMALVESQPPFALADPGTAMPLPQKVNITAYEGERIVLDAATTNNALLVLGDKYYKGWKATVDGKNTEIVPVNNVLRGVYLTQGTHKVEFRFDPLPFKIGKYLTFGSFAVFAMMLIREWFLGRKRVEGER